ncbi:MAG TPA: flagellar export chaperone FliS [Candidatus Acidoferrales bacterium]|nr:flagellar export chaperone FliS [Candidatus Acidoferrales bacterium]
MKQEDIASFYRQISAAGANPAGLVVKLYDAILEDFRRAADAIAANDIKERVARLNHALLIIAELDSVLNFERGGTVAKHLRGFYRVMRGLIVEANVRANRESVKKLIDHFMPLRQAWQKVEQEVAQNKVVLPERQSEESRRQTVSPQMEPETSGATWSV